MTRTLRAYPTLAGFCACGRATRTATRARSRSPWGSSGASRWCKKVWRRKEGIRRSEWRGLADNQSLRAEPSVFIRTGGQLEITQACNVTVTFYIFVSHERERGLAPGSSLLGGPVRSKVAPGASALGPWGIVLGYRVLTASHEGADCIAPGRNTRCSHQRSPLLPGPLCLGPGSIVRVTWVPMTSDPRARSHTPWSACLGTRVQYRSLPGATCPATWCDRHGSRVPCDPLEEGSDGLPRGHRSLPKVTCLAPGASDA